MTRRNSGTPRPAGPPPDRSRLREAALAHLARFAATERGLAQVLERRVMRWGRRAAEEGMPSGEIAAITADLTPVIAEVARSMVELGAVDDASFARARAARLTRGGRSRRMIQARLAAKGVAPETTETVLEDVLGDDEAARDSELGAALVFARRRRAGPFAADADRDEEDRTRILAAFARGGFSRDVALRALEMDPDEAMDRIIRLKDGL